MKVIAHRGLSRFYPENTLIAFKKAYEKGLTYVECDISFTKDNIPVLLHDDKIDRTSNHKGKIYKYNLDKLKEYDFGSWFNKEFKDERIPTFKEFITLCKELNLKPYVEIKPIKNKRKIKEYIKILYDIAKELNYLNEISFISFSMESLFELNKYGKFRLGLITKKLTKRDLNKFIKIKDNSNLFIDHFNKKTNKDIINLCKNNNIELELWTIESKNDLNNLDDYISGITCNYIKEE